MDRLHKNDLYLSDTKDRSGSIISTGPQKSPLHWKNGGNIETVEPSKINNNTNISDYKTTPGNSSNRIVTKLSEEKPSLTMRWRGWNYFLLLSLVTAVISCSILPWFDEAVFTLYVVFVVFCIPGFILALIDIQTNKISDGLAGVMIAFGALITGAIAIVYSIIICISALKYGSVDDFTIFILYLPLIGLLYTGYLRLTKCSKKNYNCQD